MVLLTAFALMLVSCGQEPQPTEESKAPVVATALEAPAGFDIRLSGGDSYLGGAMATYFLSGDGLLASANQGVLLVFQGGTRVAVEEKSELVVSSEGGSTMLEVARGNLLIAGEDSEEAPMVVTPAAGVTAEGQGALAVNIVVETGGNTTVRAREGSFLVENGLGRVVADAGEAVICAPGGEPSALAGFDEAEVSPGMSYPSLVDLHVEAYFSDDKAREDAELEAQVSLEVNPQDEWGNINMARVLLDRGDIERARQHFNTVIDTDPYFPQALCGVGRINLLEQRWDEAMEVFTRARRSDDESLEAVFGMGQASLGGGDLREAEKWFRETLDIDPEYHPAWTALGAIKFLNGNVKDALYDLKRSTEIDPSRSRAYMLMAVISAVEGSTGDYEEYLERAGDANGKDPRVWTSLGDHNCRSGEFEDASACFRRLQQSEDPVTKAIGYQNMGVTDMLQGDYSDGLKDLKKSIDLGGTVPALLDAGQARRLLGEIEAALGSFGEAAALDPGSFLPRQWIARTYLDEDKAEGAAQEAQASLGINPADWISHQVLGMALLAAGREDSGEAELEIAAELVPENGLSASEHALLGDGYLLLGEKEKANKEFEEALEMEPGNEVYEEKLERAR